MLDRASLPLAYLLVDKDGRPLDMFHHEPTMLEALADSAQMAGFLGLLSVTVGYLLSQRPNRRKGKVTMPYRFRAIAGSSIGLSALGFIGRYLS